MRGYTHAVVGTAASLLISSKLGMEFNAASAAIAVIAGLLPDADEQHSTINKYVPLHSGKLAYAVGAAALFYHAYKTSNILYIFPAIVALLIYISGHRGFTHSIAACGLFGLPLFSDSTRYIQFTVSYLAHLICDMTNTKGIQLLYPLRKRFKLPVNFKMDSGIGRMIESFAVFVSAIIIAGYFI